MRVANKFEDVDTLEENCLLVITEIASALYRDTIIFPVYGCRLNLVNICLQDFGEFMRENRLTPFPDSMIDAAGTTPVDRAKSQLERHTRYWPMIISQTTIFNMQAVRDTLLSYGSQPIWGLHKPSKRLQDDLLYSSILIYIKS